MKPLNAAVQGWPFLTVCTIYKLLGIKCTDKETISVNSRCLKVPFLCVYTNIIYTYIVLVDIPIHCNRLLKEPELLLTI